ncbi:hypothetical protein BpHYR1_010168 [Brachionus plicatilis]|uniref:Uncharacterized protein n=1 Tax=Brachionus plicatilis TaxID=10195 RepID=A0A3M7QPW9_BRAPC|nr:hypothetical protein BpHYR1_010168 [Brachionus plicatilis]
MTAYKCLSIEVFRKKRKKKPLIIMYDDISKSTYNNKYLRGVVLDNSFLLEAPITLPKYTLGLQFISIKAIESNSTIFQKFSSFVV